MQLELITPRNDLDTEFIQFMEEFQLHDEYRYDHELLLARKDFDEYVNGLITASKGINLAPGYVPQTTFWTLQNNQTIIGTIRIRHNLTPRLEIEGGHIGYNIRPAFRRQGLGTNQLALGLVKAKNMGFSGVLITCDTDNIGSAKIIIKNKGRFINSTISPNTQRPISRYWIQLVENNEPPTPSLPLHD